MDTMIAYRLLNAQTQPEFQEVPEPHAAPGQVLVKVGGSGLCHTDFTVISRDLSYEPILWYRPIPSSNFQIFGAVLKSKLRRRLIE
jgi:D-arabinose 1-dehydrogenase-like Zn-dependent alcohol dehydrogenase